MRERILAMALDHTLMEISRELDLDPLDVAKALCKTNVVAKGVRPQYNVLLPEFWKVEYIYNNYYNRNNESLAEYLGLSKSTVLRIAKCFDFQKGDQNRVKKEEIEVTSLKLEELYKRIENGDLSDQTLRELNNELTMCELREIRNNKKKNK